MTASVLAEWASPASETWRVATHAEHCAAHLVTYISRDQHVATKCGWEPTAPGVLLSRREAQVLHAHPCRACIKGGKR